MGYQPGICILDPVQQVWNLFTTSNCCWQCFIIRNKRAGDDCNIAMDSIALDIANQKLQIPLIFLRCPELIKLVRNGRMGVHQHAACAPLPKETCQCTCQVTGGRTFSRIVRISTAYICMCPNSCFYPQPTRLLFFSLSWSPLCSPAIFG